MKVDTEGYEVLVLEGGLETIRNTSPKLVIETHQSQDPEIIRKLLPGYRWAYHERKQPWGIQTTMIGDLGSRSYRDPGFC